jgi:hypothetical protein
MKKIKRRKSAKKGGAKGAAGKKTAPKKAKRVVRKKVITDRKDQTVLTKLKSVLDDTAARIKTLLPGQPDAKEPDQPGGEKS